MIFLYSSCVVLIVTSPEYEYIAGRNNQTRIFKDTHSFYTKSNLFPIAVH